MPGEDEMKVREIRLLSHEYRNKAFVTVETACGHSIRGIQVIQGDSGKWFVAIPSRRGHGRIDYGIDLDDPGVRADLERTVLDAFHRQWSMTWSKHGAIPTNRNSAPKESP
jgi:DNA-binding cell septation regulator SpoVG